ncbi:aldehyde dehydrogenase (NADP(+)) [Leifsonia sp. NPDC058230]|uniref:aldehyde dehydrogenase (NADP(+)) n=1 Tax=Leifsonia sp. NPDC058230 TaxID=3346391 RepID=UPI0036DF8EBA
MTTTGTSIDQAVAKADEAFELARAVSPARRAGWLEALGTALEADRETLVALAHEETHLPRPRLEGELTRTVFQLRLLAAEVARGEHLDATVDHADPSWGMGARPDLRRVNRPLGVVAVFGASNFPFAFSVLGGDTASALAAGCAVVHKAHPDHPQLAEQTGTLAVRALADAGAPDGLFALIAERDAGFPLVEHPLVKAVGFTGSTSGGRALFDRANSRPVPIPFFGELGSTNPVFVTEAAWAARGADILRGYAASATLGMGQFCTKPGFLVLPSSADGAGDTLAEAAARAPSFGLLSGRLTDGFADAVEALLHRPGVTELARLPEGDGPASVFLTLSAHEALADPELLEAEMFGPASVVIRDADARDRERMAAALTGQLTASIWAEPGDDVAGLVAMLETKAGRILFNDWPTGVTVSYAQHHGGPYPATTAPATTSVGTAAIRRFVRPVAYQGFPDDLLPPELQEDNPLGLHRRVDGEWL